MEPEEGKREYVFKFVIIGDSGVGKTSLLHHFVYSKCKFFYNDLHKIDNRQPKQTVNVEFSSKSIELGNNLIRLQLWDTAGQEKYQAVTKSYYRNSLGVIIVFDITR